MNAVQTTHMLDFEDGAWTPIPGMPNASTFRKFRIGTCEGLWAATETTYDILAITNNVPGNGHFEDVLQWFEHSCRRDKRNLRILEVWNKRLKMHLIRKRGFSAIGKDNVIKMFSCGLKSRRV